jgi:cytochrome c biogenesis protein CcmG/thiol:disulfide interchange protein DsbE
MAQTPKTSEPSSAPRPSADASGLYRRLRQTLGVAANDVAHSRLGALGRRATANVAAQLAILRARVASDKPRPTTASDPPGERANARATSDELVAPPGMVLTTPLRARLPQITAITLAIITAAVLLKGVLTPAAPKTSVNAFSTPAPTGPGIGHLAPDVTLLDLNGKPVKLSSLHGKVLVLNFWYVACEPCQTEMPALERTYLADQASGFEIVGVDPPDSASDIAAFTTRLGVTYPILRDTDLSAVDAYGVTATPTSYVIDKRGVIRDRILGPVDQSSLAKEVASLIHESSG